MSKNHFQNRTMLLSACIVLTTFSNAQTKYHVEAIAGPSSYVAIGNGGSAVYTIGQAGYVWDPILGSTPVYGVKNPNNGIWTNSINSSSTVVGYENTGRYNAVIWERATGTRKLADFIAGLDSEATDISDNGNISGWYGDHFSSVTPPRPFLYKKGQGWTPLATQTGVGTYAYTVNDAGMAAGISDGNASGEFKAFFWRADGTMVEMSHPWNTTTFHFDDMNSAGQVVGVVGNGANDYGCMWSEAEGFTRIPNSIVPEYYTRSGGINDSGIVVGAMGNGEFDKRSAFVWDAASGTRRLDSILDPSQTGWRLQVALRVNNAGQISGYGFHDGQPVGYIATPIVPEPSTLLLGLGLVSLGLWRRRER